MYIEQPKRKNILFLENFTFFDRKRVIHIKHNPVEGDSFLVCLTCQKKTVFYIRTTRISSTTKCLQIFKFIIFFSYYLYKNSHNLRFLCIIIKIPEFKGKIQMDEVDEEHVQLVLVNALFYLCVLFLRLSSKTVADLKTLQFVNYYRQKAEIGFIKRNKI